MQTAIQQHRDRIRDVVPIAREHAVEQGEAGNAAGGSGRGGLADHRPLPSSIAQENAFGRRPAVAGDFAYEPLVLPGDEFANDTTWGSPETKSADLTWTQRIARLARGRTQLEGGYSYLRGSAGGSDWTQHALPDMLLRFGLTDRLELRLCWPGYVSSDSDDPAIGSGFTGTLDPVNGWAWKA